MVTCLSAEFEIKRDGHKENEANVAVPAGAIASAALHGAISPASILVWKDPTKLFMPIGWREVWPKASRFLLYSIARPISRSTPSLENQVPLTTTDESIE